MDVRIGSKDGPQPSLTTVAQQISDEVRGKQDGWLDTLVTDPQRFGQGEQGIHKTFSDLADQVTAAVFTQASQRPTMQRHQKKRSMLRWCLFALRRSAR